MRIPLRILIAASCLVSLLAGPALAGPGAAVGQNAKPQGRGNGAGQSSNSDVPTTPEAKVPPGQLIAPGRAAPEVPDPAMPEGPVNLFPAMPELPAAAPAVPAGQPTVLFPKNSVPVIDWM